MTYKIIDLVGDIHGHAGHLVNLLQALGYERRNGAWRHSERETIFVGDLIDRGPGQIETVEIVRDMIDAGSARAVMGNHELNAIAFATPDPNNPGWHYRQRGDKNVAQHRAFLDAYGEDSPEHVEAIEFFKTLPLWLDLPDLRVVHACWHEPSMRLLAPHVDEGAVLTPEGVHAVFERGAPAFEAGEIVLKGLEAALPDGVSYFDKDGHERRRTRVAWWRRDALTFEDAAFLPPSCEIPESLRRLPVPDGAILQDDDPRPLFFGHYWFSGAPRPVAANAACLDYSVARGGELCCYSWAGERELSSENFTTIASAAELRPAAEMDLAG